MRKKFTINEKNRGELAIRGLSEKARKAFSENEMAVYECEEAKEGVDIDTADYTFKSDVIENRYYIRGTMIDADNLSLEELERTLEEFYDAIEGE